MLPPESTFTSVSLNSPSRKTSVNNKYTPSGPIFAKSRGRKPAFKRTLSGI